MIVKDIVRGSKQTLKLRLFDETLPAPAVRRYTNIIVLPLKLDPTSFQWCRTRSDQSI